MHYKRFNGRASAILTTLILALALAACSDASTPTPVSQPQISVGSVATANNSGTPTAISTATSAPATATPNPGATATLPASAAAVAPTATAVVQSGAVMPPPDLTLEEPASSQSTPLPDIADLPHLNGVVKIPLLNSNPSSAQPTPVVKANYGPNNNPKVGLQIGHYQIDQLPNEQASLRGQTGGSGGGVREVDFNQTVVRLVAALLTAKGVTVDILPATVPVGYTADVFVAIHADAAGSGGPNGYKMARSRFSAIPQTDDTLLNILYETYGKATGLPTDSSITRNMTGYYAFNSRRRLYAVSKVTPAVIVETGFLTSAADRAVLLGRTDAVAKGIADGIWQFLQSRPPLEQREKPQSQSPSVDAALEITPVYAEGGGKLIAYVSKGQRFEFFEDKGEYYSVFVPVLRQQGYIRKSDAVRSGAPR